VDARELRGRPFTGLQNREVVRKSDGRFDSFPSPPATAGRARPWDIEYGFTHGKLWLFQSRPFIGNDSLKNVPALAPLEVNPSGRQADTLSLSEVVR
jgi:hypothetical protein